jgi:Cysteine dioxygenase type I
LLATDRYEAWVIGWMPGQRVELHDHCSSAGALAVVDGRLIELVHVDGHLVPRHLASRTAIALADPADPRRRRARARAGDQHPRVLPAVAHHDLLRQHQRQRAAHGGGRVRPACLSDGGRGPGPRPGRRPPWLSPRARSTACWRRRGSVLIASTRPTWPTRSLPAPSWSTSDPTPIGTRGICPVRSWSSGSTSNGASTRPASTGCPRPTPTVGSCWSATRAMPRAWPRPPFACSVFGGPPTWPAATGPGAR